MLTGLAASPLSQSRSHRHGEGLVCVVPLGSLPQLSSHNTAGHLVLLMVDGGEYSLIESLQQVDGNTPASSVSR
jgi:hypothetical protein